MSTANHISQDDLLLFALQLLPDEEMTTAHDHLLSCEDCRKQLAWVQGDMASYAMTADVQVPPVAARERLMRSIAKEKRLAPKPVATLTAVETAVEMPTRQGNVLSFEDAPVKRRMGFAGWAGWAVAAAAIGAAGLQYQQTQGFKNDLAASRSELAQVSADASKASLVLETLTSSKAKQVALTLPSSTPALPEGHASYLGSKGSMVFVANHLTQLEPGKTYELWLIPSGKGAKPIPAGTFNPDSQGRVTKLIASLPKDVDVAAVGVTVERAGGSDTPTLPIVLMGD
jgi:anti-sigma-K factor RskA